MCQSLNTIWTIKKQHKTMKIKCISATKQVNTLCTKNLYDLWFICINIFISVYVEAFIIFCSHKPYHSNGKAFFFHSFDVYAYMLSDSFDSFHCADILYDSWSPAMTVSSVCLSILSMLSSSPAKVRYPFTSDLQLQQPN